MSSLENYAISDWKENKNSDGLQTIQLQKEVRGMNWCYAE